MSMATKEQLLSKMRENLSRLKANVETPNWMKKSLEKHIGYMEEGTIITPEIQLADLRENLADIEADENVPIFVKENIKKQIETLQNKLTKK